MRAGQLSSLTDGSSKGRQGCAGTIMPIFQRDRFALENPHSRYVCSLWHYWLSYLL